VIEVGKLDGSTMYVNEDLIGRVEHAVGGQSALYMLDGGHIIVANDPSDIVALIREEKVAVLRRALEGPVSPGTSDGDEGAGVTRLDTVRER
jgi:uncharacterized protein YlzI (FlbEa/FlbD family)